MGIKMKSLFILNILFVLFLFTTTSNTFVNDLLDSMEDNPEKEIFQTFHYLHSKEYELNSEEGLKRYRIFKRNLQWIKEENAKLDQTVYGITQFTDMTHDEFVDTVLMKPETLEEGLKELEEENLRFLKEETKNEDVHHVHEHVHHHYHHYEEKKSEKSGIIVDPDDDDNKHDGSLDNERWRGTVDHRSLLGPAKSQGRCGSCWAFAAISSMEGMYKKMKGKLTLFSEQHLVNCSNRDNGCRGGWPSNTFSWIAANGVVESSVVPYRASKGACGNLSDKLFKISSGYYYYDYRRGSRNQKSFEQLMNDGPVTVAMNASVSGFMSYRPGNSFTPFTPRGTCGGRVNHAVTLMGNVVENGIEYYICRNSWGKNWGYQGHFKIPKSNNCLISQRGWLPKMKDAPAPKPQPRPTPVPANDCVELYGSAGFSSKPLVKAC